MAQPLHHEHIPAGCAAQSVDEQEDNARCSAYHSLDIERIREARRFVGQPLV